MIHSKRFYWLSYGFIVSLIGYFQDRWSLKRGLTHDIIDRYMYLRILNSDFIITNILSLKSSLSSLALTAFVCRELDS